MCWRRRPPARRNPRRGPSAGQGRSAAGHAVPGGHVLDVTFDADTGPRTDIGPIPITGLKTMNEDFVRQALAAAQRRAIQPHGDRGGAAGSAVVGVFSVVRIKPPGSWTPQGTIPITVDVSERPLHAVEIGIAYSTDLGVNPTPAGMTGTCSAMPSSSTSPGGEPGRQCRAEARLQFRHQFIKPDFLTRDQPLELDVIALDQSLKAYDQVGVMQKIDDQPQVVGALECQRRAEGRAGGDQPGGCRHPLQPGGRAARR